ncbi:MAG: anthranilate phosphoribosyltransferase, partial [Acidimicrobiia bacterium]
LQRLGGSHVVSFHGSDGLDEITTAGPSTVWELKDGSINEYQFDPSEIGIPRARAADIKGGTAAENAKIAIDVLSGAESLARDIVVVNAAAALVAAGTAPDFKGGAERAGESIDSGKAQRALDGLIEVSNR